MEYGDPLPEGIKEYELESSVEVPPCWEVVTVTPESPKEDSQTPPDGSSQCPTG